MAETQEQVLKEPPVPSQSTPAFHENDDITESRVHEQLPDGVQLGAAVDLWFDMKQTPILMNDSFSDSDSDSKEETGESTVATNVRKIYQEYVSVLPENSSKCRPITIFSLPHYIRETNKAMYMPKLVSIGPYFLDNNGPLRTLQEHKWWCARDFLDAHDLDAQQCIRKLTTNEPKARSCYSEKIELQREEFVQMLLLDTCFILEFIRKHHGHMLDSFFNIERNRAAILTDILLLENQIPYFIIHKLFNLAYPDSTCGVTSCKLRDLIFNLFPPQILWTKPHISCEKIYHLLHFYYLCMVPDSSSKHQVIQSQLQKDEKAYDKITIGRLELVNAPKPRGSSTEMGKPSVMPSVTELMEAGVSFRRATEPNHHFDIKFSNGVMEIPALFIDDLNCILLANLLAFEQNCYGPTAIISQFVSLFDNLIDTEKDVSLLESSNVLINMIGSEEETAFFFNQLSKCNLVEHSEKYLMLMRDVQAYYTSLWPRYRAILMRDYFTNPWTTISVIAAFVLLGLAVVQTYYTIYSTIHK